MTIRPDETRSRQAQYGFLREQIASSSVNVTSGWVKTARGSVHRRVFVESFVPPLNGSNVILRFRLPSGHQVSTAGVVGYSKFESAFGVEFVDLSPFDRDQINSLVA